MVGLHILSVARHLTNGRPTPRTFTVAASWLLYKCLPRSHSLIPRHSINNSELKCSQHWGWAEREVCKKLSSDVWFIRARDGFLRGAAHSSDPQSSDLGRNNQNTLVMTIWFARITEFCDWWKTAFNKINQNKKCHEIQQSQQQRDHRTWNENWSQ